MAKYSLKKPNFGQIIGHGDLPEAIKIGDQYIPFGSTVISSKSCKYPAEEKAGRIYVNSKYIEENQSNFKLETK